MGPCRVGLLEGALQAVPFVRVFFVEDVPDCFRLAIGAQENVKCMIEIHITGLCALPLFSFFF